MVLSNSSPSLMTRRSSRFVELSLQLVAHKS
jgi:hypothetical protein